MTQEGDKQGINFGDLFKGQKESKRIDPFKVAQERDRRERNSAEIEKSEREFGLPLGRAYASYVQSIRENAPEDIILQAEDNFVAALNGTLERGTYEEKQKAHKAQLRATRVVARHSHSEPRIK